MHRQRILTAALLAPFVAAVLFYGGYFFFAALVVAITTLCLNEFYTINFPGSLLLKVSGIVAGLLPVMAVTIKHDAASLPFSIYLVFLISIIITVATYRRHDNPFIFLTTFSFGAIYTGLAAAFIMLVRYLPYGKEWIFFLIFVIFLGDAGAYYTGKAIGRHSLCPAISKGKTVEGAVGGLVLNAIGALAVWGLFFSQDISSSAFLVIIAVVTGIIGQFGDLAESIIKRAFGVKDSGHILPGHGGFYDRVDALLLAAPFFYMVVSSGLFLQH